MLFLIDHRRTIGFGQGTIGNWKRVGSYRNND
jgi:hypothetical protein